MTPLPGTELRVTLVRSVIGAKPKHRGTIRALGLRRLNHSVTLPDRPEIRGMLARVPHLVRVEGVGRTGPADPAHSSAEEESSSKGANGPSEVEAEEEEI